MIEKIDMNIFGKHSAEIYYTIIISTFKSVYNNSKDNIYYYISEIVSDNMLDLVTHIKHNVK